MKLVNSNNLDYLKTLPDNSVDSIVTDPPYGISFMGKKWDYDVPSVETWKECLRVLKHGGHILVACGTRTQHRMAVNIEDAGFEIRDIVSYMYGSGFPKSHNIGKAVDKLQGNEREVVGNYQVSSDFSEHKGSMMSIENSGGKNKAMILKQTKGNSPYEGWGTALKPAMELWTLARKPLSENNIAQNVLKWGTGGINIDGSRVGMDLMIEGRAKQKGSDVWNNENRTGGKGSGFKNIPVENPQQHIGRFPANVIHDGSDEVIDLFPNTKSGGGIKLTGKGTNNNIKFQNNTIIGDTWESNSGSASRFFYCAKASKSERNAGLDSYLTVKYYNKVCKEENMAVVRLLQKVTSEQEILSFSIDESGVNIMAQCHKDSLFTTLTTINKITESKTLNLLMHSLINESTQGVNLEMGNGGNLAESVENLRKWILSITKENQELALGVSNVALQMLLKIKEEENWNQTTNIHSTVKPVALMRYLIKLITPTGGVVLDPFMGSGSTGVACRKEGFDFIGIELDEEYFKIAEARINNE